MTFLDFEISGMYCFYNKILTGQRETVMDKDVSCRRCSVVRVNILCRLYDEGFRDSQDRSKNQLISLIKIAGDRGYPEGRDILTPALSSDHVRRVCWNISSLLTDQDFLRHGVPIV